MERLKFKISGKQIVKNFKRKFQFGGKYTYDWKNSPIKTSYGYPVYWSNNVPEEYKWVTDFLKNNPSTTGMAIGGGAQGPEDIGPRVIIRNSNSNILTDPKDPRWNGLDKIEAVRHYMNETNYNPYFKISPEQEFFRRTNFSKDAPYNTDDGAWRQSIISRIIAGDMEGTTEQMKEVDRFKKDFYKGRSFGVQ